MSTDSQYITHFPLYNIQFWYNTLTNELSFFVFQDISLTLVHATVIQKIHWLFEKTLSILTYWKKYTLHKHYLNQVSWRLWACIIRYYWILYSGGKHIHGIAWCRYYTFKVGLKLVAWQWIFPIIKKNNHIPNNRLSISTLECHFCSCQRERKRKYKHLAASLGTFSLKIIISASMWKYTFRNHSFTFDCHYKIAINQSHL